MSTTTKDPIQEVALVRKSGKTETIDLTPEPPPQIQLQGHEWHRGNVLYHVRPEDRASVYGGVTAVNTAYNSAVNACLGSAAERVAANKKLRGVGGNWKDSFKSEFPIHFPGGTYRTEGSLVKPPGISIEGNGSMESVTIRVGKSKERFQVADEKVQAGFRMIGDMDYVTARLNGVKGKPHRVDGLRVTPWAGSVICGYLYQGWQANGRLYDVAYLGSGATKEKGFGVANINQPAERITFKSTEAGVPDAVIVAKKQTAVMLDCWYRNIMIERAGIGVYVNGALQPKIQGSIYYCAMGIALVNVCYGTTECWIGDSYNRPPDHGRVKLGLFVSGRGNVCRDTIQYADDAATLENGIRNTIEIANPSGAAILRCSTLAAARGGRYQHGDYAPRVGGKSQSVGRWKTGDRVWGPSLAAYRKYQQREEKR